MTTMQLKGKDPRDLNTKLWDWRSAHPTTVATKVHPDEALPLEMQSPRPGEKLSAPDCVSRRIEYED
jgi:hypothetical protein